MALNGAIRWFKCSRWRGVEAIVACVTVTDTAVTRFNIDYSVVAYETLHKSSDSCLCVLEATKQHGSLHMVSLIR